MLNEDCGCKIHCHSTSCIHSTTATTGSPHQLLNPYFTLSNTFLGHSLVFLDGGTKVLQSVSKHLQINILCVPETLNLQIIMKWSILNFKTKHFC